MPAGPTAETEPTAVPLPRLRRGDRGVVHAADLDAGDAALLGAMGLRPAAELTVRRTGHPCIVELRDQSGCSARIGLARDIARRVMVSPPAL